MKGMLISMIFVKSVLGVGYSIAAQSWLSLGRSKFAPSECIRIGSCSSDNPIWKPGILRFPRTRSTCLAPA
ncbi:unnamed protein product [Clonostachys rosea f. rosea IK726]|uniref:Secreted protein n=2 Tax=Bionectria ochroleuca TaxID=29856 RepID=A0A0B7K1X7_BIOOC|nr:unnamed protein product [Clonostachys rosea f. rosea IK726]